MEIFLRYLGDPGFQSGVAEDYEIHRTTACKTVSLVLNKVCQKADHSITFPTTVSELNDAKVKWQSRFTIPTVIGALDCTHVKIKRPGRFVDEYVNRKGYTSINVQTTCDASEKFTSIDAQWSGSVHDGRIWRRSIVNEVLSQFKGSFCLLGDSGYGISPWLLTPFKPAINRQQERFNLLHSRERVTIERLFGQLKMRFPILGNTVRVSSEKVPKIILCCAVLHNVAKYLNDDFNLEEAFEDEPLDEVMYEDEEDDDRNPLRRLGVRKREDIIAVLNL
ncbi:unnamed protein product [Acanthoscelides obtectus]|uniref:Putative nuclease HARBI1 n=1 Tax=Acanthoscelides obtectus TaxID=200917 RepID=A0A9P0PIJ2_ACAOB|nr:unnamed protein product [Acanthoscelides obtectus]CAK1639375.1 Putative nuclease HARBI1 [Acanthoscelides obtectus]